MAINGNEQALNAILNGEANNSVSQANNIKKIIFKKSYFGISYDPEEHIYTRSHYMKQELFKRVSNDDEFALYLNFPVYKVEYTDRQHYFVNLLTGDTTNRSILQYSETMFDMSNESNYVKLDTPIPNKFDGCFAVLEYGVKYTLSKGPNDEKFKVKLYDEE